jgi:hypothetical protein
MDENRVSKISLLLYLLEGQRDMYRKIQDKMER